MEPGCKDKQPLSLGWGSFSPHPVSHFYPDIMPTPQWRRKRVPIPTAQLLESPTWASWGRWAGASGAVLILWSSFKVTSFSCMWTPWAEMWVGRAVRGTPLSPYGAWRTNQTETTAAPKCLQFPSFVTLGIHHTSLSLMSSSVKWGR